MYIQCICIYIHRSKQQLHAYMYMYIHVHVYTCTVHARVTMHVLNSKYVLPIIAFDIFVVVCVCLCC